MTILYTLLSLVGGACFGILANKLAISNKQYSNARRAGTLDSKRIGQYDGDHPVPGLTGYEEDPSIMYRDADWWKKL